VIATLFSPALEVMDVRGHSYLEDDIMPITSDGRDARFVYPFGGGFFGDVYQVRVGLTNVRCVMKRLRVVDMT